MVIGITCYPVAGGSGIVATELGQQLALRGHQVHFISYAIPFRLDRYQTNVLYHGVETTAYPLFKSPPYTLTLAAKMAEVTRSFGVDVLHMHYAIPHAASAYLARQMLLAGGGRAPKVITTLHGTDITLVGPDPSFFDITRFSIMTSDG
ncbi:MAG TPA: glycosyltransferase, partial [candidate division Zixibacteria bacterium]|nr:glycosyltransferase [candidate division Zixibacteria bacterium]